MIKKIVLLLVIIFSLFSLTLYAGTANVHADGGDIPFEDIPVINPQG